MLIGRRAETFAPAEASLSRALSHRSWVVDHAKGSFTGRALSVPAGMCEKREKSDNRTRRRTSFHLYDQPASLRPSIYIVNESFSPSHSLSRPRTLIFHYRLLVALKWNSPAGAHSFIRAAIIRRGPHPVIKMKPERAISHYSQSTVRRNHNARGPAALGMKSKTFYNFSSHRLKANWALSMLDFFLCRIKGTHEILLRFHEAGRNTLRGPRRCWLSFSSSAFVVWCLIALNVSFLNFSYRTANCIENWN